MKASTPRPSPPKPGLTILIEFTGPIARLPYVFISRTGVFAFGWLFVHVGFMTKDYRVGFDTIARELAKKHGKDQARGPSSLR
ncbi:hypothetical protein LCGC14_0520550 [marine sediment metagenome]|uniref:Uncharacterized protein n=1 Tax=marine sediment metagenome TaxID=412755 RepID=A0A0F9SH30_9ZZZZ